MRSRKQLNSEIFLLRESLVVALGKLLNERKANAVLRKQNMELLSDMAHSTYPCQHCHANMIPDSKYQCCECDKKVRMQGKCGDRFRLRGKPGDLIEFSDKPMP